MEKYCIMCGQTKEAAASILDENLKWAIDALNIKIYNDVGTSVCSDCLQKLKKWSQFLQKAENTYEKLLANQSSTSNKEHNLCKKFNIRTCFVRLERVQLEVKSSQTTEKNNIDRPYGCNKCKKQYKSTYHLKRHISTHNKSYKCKKCNKVFISFDIIKQHRSQCSFRYGCDKCDMKFQYRSLLIEHHKSHSDRHPYKCTLCPWTFKKQSDLASHKSVIHVNERIFKCPKCSYTCQRNTVLIKHLRQVHTMQRSFKCDQCGKTFKSKGDLRQHIKQHSKLRIYVCRKCKKCFKTKETLGEHKLTHNKVYECDYCNKQLNLKSKLIAHLKIHAN